MLVGQYKIYENGLNTFPGIIIINDKILGTKLIVAIDFPFLADKSQNCYIK